MLAGSSWLTQYFHVVFQHSFQRFTSRQAVERDAVLVAGAVAVYTGKAQGVGLVVPYRILQVVGVNQIGKYHFVATGLEVGNGVVTAVAVG